jgi:ABC-type phosphate/phosphonate transport system substrate-binding protein
MRKFKHFGMLLLLVFFCGACNIPKDPNNSYENAKKSSLRVGIVSKKDSTTTSFEKNLVANFAEQEKMQTQFTIDNETELVKKLENYQLDIVLGGFEKKSNWKTQVGMTKPYDGKHVLFIPRGENRLLYQLEKFIIQNQKP